MKIVKTFGKVLLGIIVGLVALFVLGYVLTLGDYAVAETVAQDPSLPHITVDEITYHAETFGDPADPVVIVIHGGPGGDYRTILSLQALSDQYFVVFYDQRGSGLSPRVDPEAITLASALADLDSIVDYYGQGKQVNLVGHSWGAMLASAYLGQHPDKVDHAVLAEPGFLTSEFAEAWTEETQLRLSPGALYHFVKTKFEALHVKGPDEHASDDYFGYQVNMYQGRDHPQAGYRCEGGGPEEGEFWRFGARVADSLFQEAVDADGNFDINLVEGVEAFTNKVLFMAGECQKVIGVAWQKEQMAFFPNADLAVIPEAGHEMFLESPEASIAAVRAYLNAPVLAQNRETAGVNTRFALPQQQGQGPTDPAELEAFLDRLFAEHMREHHIAGAAVSVVKDGELFFAKGYGYANLDAGTPVDPAQTGFNVASVSKLFAWTAVMQLVEQGVLDLDADINTYLDFKIPDTYEQPITLAHLLTHTSGFEYSAIDDLARDVDDLVPARDWLVSHIPARVRPPGQVAGYSNYNTNLAGYMVARVSGMPYDQYVRQEILDPLGMAHTSIESIAPPELEPYQSVGYTYDDGAFQAFPKYWAQPAILPAAGLAPSATDMAHFMIAYLQDGRYGDARILQAETVQRMRGTLFTPDPRISGNVHGFFDFTDSGVWTIGHDGGAPDMNSQLLLLPDWNLGLFVAYNSEGSGGLTTQHLGFQRAFYDHYFPAPPVAPLEPPADFARRAGRFTGSYRITRSGYSTLEKVSGLFSEPKIVDPGDGTLLLTAPWGEWRFVEVEPLYFRQVDGEFTLVFHENDRGRITYMSAGFIPQFAFEKLSWYETAGLNMILAGVCALLFLSALVVALIRLVLRRRRGSDRVSSARGARAADWIAVGISLLNLLFVMGTVLWGNPHPVFGVSLIYRLVLALPVLAAVLTVGALVTTVLAWKDDVWGLAGRVHYTLVTVAAVAFVWFLNYWNLLGWRF